MTTVSPTHSPLALVVLMPGADARVLGLSIRDRNGRVAARAGATVVDAAALDSYGDQIAVLVPPLSIIDSPLFQITPPGSVARFGSDAHVIIGPARALVPLVEAPQNGEGLPFHAAHGAVMDGSSLGARRRAAWQILLRTAKPTDGWVSRHCNRPISRLFSFVLLGLRLRASHASLLTLLVGIVAAALAALPGYAALVATGVLFHLASVLDGVDGEMARATFTESDAGARLDAIVDQLTYLACFVGLIIGWGREGGGRQAVLWGLAIAGALVLSLMRGGAFVSRYAPNASFVFIDRCVRRAARDSGRMVLKMAAAGFALLRRDLFSVVFMAVSLTGFRVLVPALVVAGIALANLTFSFYQRELAAAALLENPDARG